VANTSAIELYELPLEEFFSLAEAIKEQTELMREEAKNG
jgi:hypothetical protein